MFIFFGPEYNEGADFSIVAVLPFSSREIMNIFEFKLGSVGAKPWQREFNGRRCLISLCAIYNQFID